MLRQPRVGAAVALRRPPQPCCALAISARTQYVVGETRTTARRSKAAFHHPLAPKDPASRNVTLPDALLKGKGALTRPADKQPAEVLKRRAQMALLQQLQQEVLWDGSVLDDANHKLVQHFMKLGANPKYRDARRMMMVGGREMIRELCAGGHVPRHLLVTEGKAIPEWARREQAKQKMDIVLVNRRVAEACAPGNDGYVGDFDIPPPPMKETLIANKQRMRRVLVLDNVDDAGLLGTLLRTATGFQFDAVIATNHCADLYDHRVVRAARGAHFQTGVPIYSLKDEDGDDVYAMLNHVIARNNLLPVCYTPVNDAEEDVGSSDGLGKAAYVSSVVGAHPVPVAPTISQRPTPQQNLSDFCLERFTQRGGSSTRPEPDRASEDGYMLFAGPNHKRNMLRRLTRRVARPPTQLLLDSMPEEPDMLLALSVVLHALRPAGDWDYLPLSERAEPSTMALQTRTASVDLGPDRLIMSEKSLNLDEDEQRRAADTSNAFAKWRRQARRQKTDYDMWVEAEEARVRAAQRWERVRRMTPWDTRRLLRKGPAPAEEGGMPSWVPNIIDEYRLPLDRDRLREEQEASMSYVRPGNYGKFER